MKKQYNSLVAILWLKRRLKEQGEVLGLIGEIFHRLGEVSGRVRKVFNCLGDLLGRLRRFLERFWEILERSGKLLGCIGEIWRHLGDVSEQLGIVCWCVGEGRVTLTMLYKPSGQRPRRIDSY
jgi:hypothetical protein